MKEKFFIAEPYITIQFVFVIVTNSIQSSAVKSN